MNPAARRDVPLGAPAPAASDAGTSAEAERKRELRAFLMSRRARLKPADVGLPQTHRRRTPGLRREEVAALAGLSTAWYTLFEMAKETRVSPKSLDAIARALRLSPAESRHLAVLTGAAGPASRAIAAPPDPVTQAVLDGYAAGPALVLDDRMDVLALNGIAARLFGDLTSGAGFERNWLWRVVSSSSAIANLDGDVPSLASAFRATYCEHAHDPAYAALLDELLRTSDAFRQSWPAHDVAPSDDARPLTVRDPVYGELRFAIRSLPVATGSQGRWYFFVPDDATRDSPAYRALLAVAS